MLNTMPRSLLTGLAFALAAAVTTPVDAYPHPRSAGQGPSGPDIQNPWYEPRGKAAAPGEPMNLAVVQVVSPCPVMGAGLAPVAPFALSVPRAGDAPSY